MIQYPNHRTAKTSQSSGFLVLTEYRTDRLLYLSELVAVLFDKESIEHIPADCIPYLI